MFVAHTIILVNGHWFVHWRNAWVRTWGDRKSDRFLNRGDAQFWESSSGRESMYRYLGKRYRGLKVCLAPEGTGAAGGGAETVGFAVRQPPVP